MDYNFRMVETNDEWLEGFREQHVCHTWIPDRYTGEFAAQLSRAIHSGRYQDVSPIFEAAGIEGWYRGTMSDYSYDLNPEDPESNWLYVALQGFRKLKPMLDREGKAVDTFATLGSGHALDAVGGYKVFNPKNVVMTDINAGTEWWLTSNFLRHIREPVWGGENGEDIVALNYVDKQVRTYSLIGNLCEPLRERGLVADVMYANLPNIPEPDTAKVHDGMNSATFIDEDAIAAAPQKYHAYHLGLQHTLLQNARDSLSDQGSLLVNLGGRVPVELVRDMFHENGYGYEELFNHFKVQTEPEEVLTGYSVQGEQRYGVEFDYYRYDEAKRLLGERKPQDLSVEQLKELMSSVRVSATEGLERHHQGERLGHIVQLVRGVKQ